MLYTIICFLFCVLLSLYIPEVEFLFDHLGDETTGAFQ